MSALLLTLLLAATPADEAALLAEAEAAFAAGLAHRDDPTQARPHFRRAAGRHEQLRQEGVSNPVFYLNQGNAALLADDLPAALLAYHRGLRLRPHDRTLQAQRTWAREQVAYPQPGAFARPPVEYRPPWLPRLPVFAGLALTWLLVASGCVALTRAAMRRSGRLASLGVTAFVFAGLFGGALAWQEADDRAEERHPLVVIAQDGVLLRRGNGEAYPRRSDVPLPRGVEARWRFERGDWVQIELGSGEVGWVPREYVLIDRP
jgi:hypothetical protein